MAFVGGYGDVGERINKEIDLKKIKSKEEYFKEVQRVLRDWDRPKDHRSLAMMGKIDAIYVESGARDVIEKNTLEVEELKARALAFEARRPRLSRIRDERKTSRDTREVNNWTYERWRRGGYRRSDLWGVDTKRPHLGVSKQKMRKIVITNADRRLVNARVFINTTNRQKSYRSVDTGRFIPNPFSPKRRKR